MKLALYGGAFDPPHLAHLDVARAARDRFGLERVLFVPAANPPHKRMSAGYADRMRMVELAIAGEPGFEASRLEEGAARNYSIDTIERLRPSLAREDTLYFLIGADAFSEIETWKRWREVIAAVEFLVVSRPGHDFDVPEGARVERLDTLALVSSSSDVRAQIARGETPSDVTPAVMNYIRERGLYRPQM